MKDEFANLIQDTFLAEYPASSWGNFAKERGQITTLAKKIRQLRQDVPFEDNEGLFIAMFQVFMNLRGRNAGKQYWQCPVVPSAFVQRWDQIVAALSSQFEQHQAIEQGKQAAKEDVPF